MSDVRRRGAFAWFHKESSEFRILYIAAFSVFLLSALVSRLLPWHRRDAVAPRERKSIVAEARASAHTFIPFAFMG